MLNQAYVGRSLPATTPVPVTAESVDRFAAALGQPGGDRRAPATYLVSVSLPAIDPLIADPDFGLDFTRVLHREQRFVFERPVVVGDVVSCVPTVESIKVVAGNELLTVRTEVTASDEPVATVWTTLFVAADDTKAQA